MIFKRIRLLKRKLGFYCSQRFAAWRSGGFLAQKFNRRTALEPTTKLSYEALNPPLRQTAVISWPFVHRPCKPLSILRFSVCVVSAVRLRIFCFRKGERFFLITHFIFIFYWCSWTVNGFNFICVGKVEALLQALVFALAFAACKCAWLRRVGWYVYCLCHIATLLLYK